MTINDHLSQSTIDAINEALDSVPLEQHPFSPIGLAANLPVNVELFCRVAEDENRALFLKSGVYPLRDKVKKFLCFINLPALEEGLSRITEEAKESGNLVTETDEEGNVTETLRGNQPTDLSWLKDAVKPILLPTAKGNLEELSLLEVAVCLAVERAADEDTRNTILREMFIVAEDEPRRKTRGKAAPKVPYIQSANDSVTNAIFGRDKNAIQPAQYFQDEPIEVITGNGLSAKVLVASNFNIDEAVEVFLPEIRDRVWLDLIHTMAIEGRTEITGSDLLKAAGFSNAYKKESPAMTAAVDSTTKMLKTLVAIDTSNESAKYDKRRGRRIGSIQLQPIISGVVTLEKYEDKTHDFVLKLTPPDPSDPITALPLLQYASDKGQILALPNDGTVFKGPEKLSVNLDRLAMWSYVERRINAKGQSNTIVMETLFKNMGLNKEQKQKKDRLKTALSKMLRNAKASGRISSYSWKDKGTVREAVTITPTKAD